MNLDYVRSYVLSKKPAASQEDIDVAIARAKVVLKNLIHYRSGGTREDEDVAFMASVLLSDQEVR